METPKNLYLFVYGRDPRLSEAEVKMYFHEHLNSELVFNARAGAIFSFKRKIDCQKIIRELGGITKIVRILGRDDEETEKKVLDELNSVVLEKLSWGISYYNAVVSDKLREQIKDSFKQLKIKAQQKKPRSHKFFDPREISKNFIEFVKFKGYIGITESITDSVEYKQRDEERPDFEARKVTSIRLAKILINLAGTKEDDILLDPFCGSATILQEATLRGIKSIGSDIDIGSAKKNLSWMANKHKIDVQLYTSKSKDIGKTIGRQIDVVVTEPWMGPYMKMKPSEKDGEVIIKKIRRMYEETFFSLHDYVKKRMVIVVPRLKTKGKTMGLGLPKLMARTGWVEEELIGAPIVIDGRVIDRLILVVRPV